MHVVQERLRFGERGDDGITGGFTQTLGHLFGGDDGVPEAENDFELGVGLGDAAAGGAGVENGAGREQGDEQHIDGLALDARGIGGGVTEVK